MYPRDTVKNVRKENALQSPAVKEEWKKALAFGFFYGRARKGSYRFKEIKENIRLKYPLIRSGFEHSGLLFPTGGHEWVCDGLRHIDDDFELLYMHWGWGGEYNGWFFDRFFDPRLDGEGYDPWLRMVYDIVP